MGGDILAAASPLYGMVSIHAPAWGATNTPHPFFYPVVRDGFNPRPRMGGDAAMELTLQPKDGFNPRPRMGGDIPSVRGIDGTSWFQSTPPHGGRLLPHFVFLGWISFNPRPRMGGDSPLSYQLVWI